MSKWTQAMRRCATPKRAFIIRASIPSYRQYFSESLSLEGHVPEVKENVVEPESQDTHLDPDIKSLNEYCNGQKEHVRSHLRRSLPMSPLMDEHFLAATQRHHLLKAAPSKNPTAFQQQLARNPYARALATPVRMCILTKINLPSFFLQDFELIVHPTTNELWYLPRSLTSPHSPIVSTKSTAGVLSVTPSQGTRQGPKVWVLSRSAILRATVSNKRSPFKKGYERFPSSRSLQWKTFRSDAIRWRTDIDMFVLELMRRRIVEGLKYLHGRQKGYLAPCRSWNDVPVKNVIGAILWSGSHEPGKLPVGRVKRPAEEEELARDNKNEEDQTFIAQMKDERMDKDDVEDGEIGEKVLDDKLDESKVSTAPSEFATLDVDKTMKSKIPVHNLWDLLGEAHIKELRQALPKIFAGELAVLKNKHTTIDIQLRLWKLQGYLSRHGYVDDV